MKNERNRMIKPLISQLAVNIVEHLRSQTMAVGAHLVEQVLADMFHVSRSPIREALVLLQREGVVIFRPNRGFFLAHPATDIKDLNIEVPNSLEEEKYYCIAQDRVQGKIHGHISETELMSRYGISRVKLMKILVRMSQEGWVERLPGHGWNFLPVLDTIDSLEQSYRFRMLIEPAALLEPTYRVDPILFSKLRNEQESLLANPINGSKPLKLFESGSNFHEQIVSCSGNRFFLEAIQHINRLRRLIEYSVRVDESRLNAYSEHIEIMTMLERGRNSAASALLRDHIDQAMKNKIVESADKHQNTKS
jgi:DNA-binding GntR family transcriptional regulator